MISPAYGSIDFPNYNAKFAQHSPEGPQYTYLTQLWKDTSFTDNYSFPIVKYDSKKGEVVASWDQPSTLAQEAIFVPSPSETSEDDGVLMTVAYNFKEKISSLVIIDAKTMTTLNEWPLPFKLAGGFHASWWPTEQKDDVQLIQ